MSQNIIGQLKNHNFFWKVGKLSFGFGKERRKFSGDLAER